MLDFVINSDILGCQWRKLQGESNTYQMVIVRKDKHPGYQGCFYTFPDEQEYDTKDVFKPHPSLPNHWVYYARSDGMISFNLDFSFNVLPTPNLFTQELHHKAIHMIDKHLHTISQISSYSRMGKS